MLLNLDRKLKNQSLKSAGNRKMTIRLQVLGMFLAVFLFVPLLFIFWGAKDVAIHGKVLVAAYKGGNFDDLKKESGATKFAFQKVDFPLNFLFWLRVVPFIGGYYLDAKGFSSAGVEEITALEKIILNLEPYKKEIGFNNQSISGQDRISQSIKILNKTLPILNQVQDNLEKAGSKVKSIDTNKYPESFKGIKVKSLVTLAKDFILGAAVAAKEGKQALEIAPQALGLSGEKNYLLLFQNDKEIRPSGGFITAFATLKLDSGKISTTASDDIYKLDEKLLNVCKTKICPLTPPAPIVKYLPEMSGKARSAWSMRDSNISPDVPTAAKEFERMYQLLGEGLPFEGIIYIDSQVVEELIDVTGPIDVFGTTYSSEVDKRCNCPNVIYELESYAEIAAKGTKDRKAVLGVLMQQILARAVFSDIEKMPRLIDAVVNLANDKHIMFYMHDEKTQKALSALNWIGEIKNTQGDYLHINDSNFAGGKSNLYVIQKVTQDINIQKDGTVKKKVIIEYENPQVFGTWLNGINRDYVRLYVPKGSQLISSKGSDDKVLTSEDLEKTVFEAFITVRPQNKRKLEFEFTSPYQPKGKYELMVQKQPGAKDFKYNIKLNGHQVADFDLKTDRNFSFSL